MFQFAQADDGKTCSNPKLQTSRIVSATVLCLERCGKPLPNRIAHLRRGTPACSPSLGFLHGNLALACYRFRTAPAFTKRIADFPRKSMYTSVAPHALDGNLEPLWS
jgi:hypothetical protein